MKKTIILFMLASFSLHANSDQRCDDGVSATTPDSRFIVHNDGTVTDNKTRLMWKQCAEGLSGSNCSVGQAETYSWEEAIKAPQSINTQGGFSGYSTWRVPNIKELRSIVEESCTSPSINLSIFPNHPNDDFWSSTPYAKDSTDAWRVYFDYGFVGPEFRIQRYSLKLVRDIN